MRYEVKEYLQALEQECEDLIQFGIDLDKPITEMGDKDGDIDSDNTASNNNDRSNSSL